MKKVMFFLTIVSFLSFSGYSQNSESIKTKKEQKITVGTQVPSNLVCMVNDAYMGKPQIPVKVI